MTPGRKWPVSVDEALVGPNDLFEYIVSAQVGC